MLQWTSLALLVGCIYADHNVEVIKSGVKGGGGGGNFQYNPEANIQRFWNNSQQQWSSVDNQYNSQGSSFYGQQGYNQVRNLTQPLDFEVGVCYVEVPTASLVHDPTHVPRGNGSKPELSRIRSCCKGYVRNIYNFKKCDPVCTQECFNALCTAPETCTCYPDHIKNRAGFCVPTCPIGCQNGNCAGGECVCKDGFMLDSSRKYCVPFCRENCGGTGNCTAPNTCECKPGFVSTPQGSCQSTNQQQKPNQLYPSLDQFGSWLPNQLNQSYNPNSPYHPNQQNYPGQPNQHGNPNQPYYPGQQYPNQSNQTNYPNQPHYPGQQIAPNQPYPGQPGSHLNNPQPGQNIPGNSPYDPYPTSQPDKPNQHNNSPYEPYPGQNQPYHPPNQPYLTNPGHNPTNQQYPGQNPTNQQYPGQNPTNQQYPGQNPTNQQYPGQNPTNQQQYPGQSPYYQSGQQPINNTLESFDLVGGSHCAQSCVNGVCGDGNRCNCNTGYILDRTDPTGFRCIPHCPGGCENGVCSSPNFCICNMGYHKDTSVKGAPRCVRRIRRSVAEDQEIERKRPVNVAELLVFEIPDY